MTYTLGKTLLKIDHVSLSYDGRPILRDVCAEIKELDRSDGCGQVIGILGPSGIGKCLARGTPVLMFDGTIMKVEDVKQHDRLMGPDSMPRRVLSLSSSYGAELFDVIPTKGDSYRVNGDHILALHLIRSKKSKYGNIEITVRDYLRQSKTFKSRAKGYRVGVSFPATCVPLDPYFLGLWLGDGTKGDSSITTADPEIVESIKEVAESVGGSLSIYDYHDGRCPRYNIQTDWDRSTSVQTTLRKLGILHGKHVPLSYKANDKSVRLSLLAGLLDADGSLENNCFVITLKLRRLADDCAYIARSLGLAAYLKPCRKKSQRGTEGEYYRVTISGDTDMIPVRLLRRKAAKRKQIKDVLRTGITVKPAGRGEYFGFHIDGDGLFLLGDFTVTHNTQLFRIISGLNKPTTGEVILDGGIPVHPGLVGVVAQNYPLFEHRTIMSNLLLAAKRGKHENSGAASSRVMDYLEEFDLVDKASLYPVQLSGGQRQRVSIIQQILCSDHFLLMDEPFSGLDMVALEKVALLIQKVANLNKANTIIVVSHDITTICGVSDHVALLGRERDVDGKIIPGARIIKIFDLAAEGLCWQPDIITKPAFVEFVRGVKEMFRTL